MFVKDAIHIERPFEDVAPRFLSNPGWLEPLVSAAVGEPSVRCRRGTARHRADSLVVPMRWAIDAEASFPSLDGDLVIAPIGTAQSRLLFEATYTIDPQKEGAVRATAQVVETAVGAFLEGLALALRPHDSRDGQPSSPLWAPRLGPFDPAS
jgi:hypothetical protein